MGHIQNKSLDSVAQSVVLEGTVRSVALVVGCADPRIHFDREDWLFQQYGEKALIDRIILAGATKEIDVVLRQVKLLHHHHQFPKLILTHHEDCVAYGGAACPIHGHAGILYNNKALFEEVLPVDVEIEMYVQTLDGLFLPAHEHLLIS